MSTRRHLNRHRRGDHEYSNTMRYTLYRCVTRVIALQSDDELRALVSSASHTSVVENTPPPSAGFNTVRIRVWNMDIRRLFISPTLDREVRLCAEWRDVYPYFEVWLEEDGGGKNVNCSRRVETLVSRIWALRIFRCPLLLHSIRLNSRERSLRHSRRWGGYRDNGNE